jgi:hypothetical protein
MKMEFDAPWGKLDLTQPIREHVKHLIKQLKYLLRNNESTNPYFTKIDLKGYQILRDEASDETIKKFLELKSKARKEGKRQTNNIQVINYLKTSGQWVRK